MQEREEKRNRTKERIEMVEKRTRSPKWLNYIRKSCTEKGSSIAVLGVVV